MLFISVYLFFFVPPNIPLPPHSILFSFHLPIPLPLIPPLDMEVCKSYTVVPSAIMEEKADLRTAKGQVLYLMIKIYSDGELTPQIGKLQTGEILIIDY